MQKPYGDCVIDTQKFKNKTYNYNVEVRDLAIQICKFFKENALFQGCIKQCELNFIEETCGCSNDENSCTLEYSKL